ncbi:hypothetical protein UFOVP33_47 [uncultured Caudovirales phage]|uniref:Uncharacterized protein n=1 Tax=uncultured Caudovirales phage TaxID=2100421 RepID=A0A6J5KNG7_9CAUD|nr:hypothetical protein UFOVP33_47 [uncultured Caudovirales phage]
MKALKRIFYIYSEASLAVFFAFGALVEFACAYALGDNFLGGFSLTSGFVLLALAVQQVRYIVRCERGQA